MPILNKKIALNPLLLSLLLVVFSYSLNDLFPFFNRLSLKFSDYSRNFAYLSGLKPSIGKEAVFIMIDQKTLDEFGTRFPFPRKWIAEILEKIAQANPRLLAMDLTFGGNSENKEEDILLAQAIKKLNKKTVLFTYIDENMAISPLLQEAYEAASGIGIINLIHDPDGIIRSALPYYIDPKTGKIVFCAESLLALRYHDLPLSDIAQDRSKNALIFKTKNSPLKPAYFDSKFRLEYKEYFRTQDLQSISFCDVYQGRYDMNLLENKIVFIGNQTLIQHDFHLTPSGVQAGINIVYNIFLTFINGSFPRPMPYGLSWIGMVILVWSGLAVLFSFTHGKNLLAVFPILLLMWITDYIFFRLNITWNGFLPVFCIASAALVREGWFYYETWIDNLKIKNKLKETQKEILLSQKLANVGKIAAQIAHELKNPLGNLINMKLWFRQYIPAEHPANECIEALDKEAQRMLKLSQQMLQFSRPANENYKAADIHDLIKDTLGFLKGSLDKKKIQLKTSFSPARAFLRGNADQLKQVFLNLIMNAMDAMEDGGELTIETKVVNSIIEIRISDTGMGISKENLEKIFDLFFTTKGEKGSGLGLSICHDIIKKHNGRILAESEEGKGSTFLLIFPLGKTEKNHE
ncbi:MAG: CHASE2 domain-containing protein [Candidatus Aureabacteria bacterium]|nr:CHASE2 domain-containing protein [Candidatus Auribacterota bacterium]